MFYLFILESIGTSELLLIGLIALIVFGPRKLPELARMLGKAMNEFRRSTDDFKRTWEREVDFESDGKDNQPALSALSTTDNSIERNPLSTKNEIAAPEIREINQADFQEALPKKETPTVPAISESKAELSNKRDWL